MANIQGISSSPYSQTVVVDNLSFPAGDYTQITIYNFNTGESRSVNYGSSTTSGSATFSGLSPNTTYFYYAETTYGGGSRRIPESGYTPYTTLPPPKPAPLGWSPKTSGYAFSLQASSWNQMTNKINEWRNYFGYSTMSFTTAYSGNALTASMFNQVCNAISTMSPPITQPAPVSIGDPVTALKINRIAESIDSLVYK